MLISNLVKIRKIMIMSKNGKTAYFLTFLLITFLR
jgi:hypothetical protein